MLHIFHMNPGKFMVYLWEVRVNAVLFLLSVGTGTTTNSESITSVLISMNLLESL